MNLQRCPILGYGKSETPENTVRRLETALSRHYQFTIQEGRTAEYLYWSGLFMEGNDAVGMGKGISPLLSRASALAETAERLSIRDLTRLPGYLKAHQRDVPHALPIEKLLVHISSATPDIIREIQDTDLAQHWVDAHSLLTEKTVKVPLAYIHGISGTNGLASGNRLEEAIVQATAEVFERRAAITVLRSKLIMPTFDPATILNPVIQTQLEALRKLNIEIVLKDFSFGGILPCVGVYLVNHNVPPDLQLHHILNVGTSFDREDAIMRALTEFAQGRKFETRPVREGFERLKCRGDETDHFLALFKYGYVPYTHADFLLEGDVVPFERGTLFTDCLDEIDRAKTIFRQLERDFLVVDCTDPRIGFPVAQVIVPGYSDILPYHPKSSRVLFRGWSRDDAIGYYDKAKD
jgi:ribosomal protein S12 methylthiotransferase accessory factor